MEVVKVRNEDNHIRYYLNDDNGEPIEEILKFLKFKDNTGYARNTLLLRTTIIKPSKIEIKEPANLNKTPVFHRIK